MTGSATAIRAGAEELRREAKLVSQARDDPDAFAALYDMYVGRVYHYAYRRLGTHADAEDLTSQTFQRALEALPRYESRGLPFGAWLFRIAHNLLVDHFRSAAPADPLEDANLLDDPAAKSEDDPGEAVAMREEIDAAWVASTPCQPFSVGQSCCASAGTCRMPRSAR